MPVKLLNPLPGVPTLAELSVIECDNLIVAIALNIVCQSTLWACAASTPVNVASNLSSPPELKKCLRLSSSVKVTTAS